MHVITVESAYIVHKRGNKYICTGSINTSVNPYLVDGEECCEPELGQPFVIFKFGSKGKEFITSKILEIRYP